VRQAKVRLIIALVVIALGYFTASVILPRLGLQIGFEAGLVLTGLTVIIGYIIAAVICSGVAIRAARLLRRSPAERSFLGYAVLVISTGITLFGVYLLVLTLAQIHL
jgi:dipeptide/tripeptide permease